MTTTAILIERHGKPDVLVERQRSLSAPGPDEVRLAVEACGVNFADLLMRAGLYRTVPPRPYSPGFEVAGVVEEVGSAVRDWQVGDRAVALMRHGGYAHHVVLPAAQLWRYPDALTPVEAAAVPVVFLTAWICLFETGHARAGDTALVLGAAGGVGTAAVQLARWRGLRVVGTAGSAAKRRFVTGDLGAEACFDARGRWADAVRGLIGERRVDVALDAVGGRATAACRALLAPLGRVVVYGMSEALPGRRRSWLRAARAWLATTRVHPLALVQPNAGLSGVHLLHLGARQALLGPALEEVFRAIMDGALRPVVDCTFPLDRDGAVAAHEYLHARRNLGKVVLARQH
ncbi:MAG: zinc-binding dehydrogenase [Candidatus Eiseniibacteriota bacterium]|jgi:NADPH:quinone reductase-like Zn-dependent oxidoreductase